MIRYSPSARFNPDGSNEPDCDWHCHCKESCLISAISEGDDDVGKSVTNQYTRWELNKVSIPVGESIWLAADTDSVNNHTGHIYAQFQNLSGTLFVYIYENGILQDSASGSHGTGPFRLIFCTYEDGTAVAVAVNDGFGGDPYIGIEVTGLTYNNDGFVSWKVDTNVTFGAGHDPQLRGVEYLLSTPKPDCDPCPPSCIEPCAEGYPKQIKLTITSSIAGAGPFDPCADPNSVPCDTDCSHWDGDELFLDPIYDPDYKDGTCFEAASVGIELPSVAGCLYGISLPETGCGESGSLACADIHFFVRLSPSGSGLVPQAHYVSCQYNAVPAGSNFAAGETIAPTSDTKYCTGEWNLGDLFLDVAKQGASWAGTVCQMEDVKIELIY